MDISGDQDDPAGWSQDASLTLPALIEARAADRPDRPFLVEVTGRSLSYAQTERAVARWRTHLRSLGVGVGDRVGSFLPPSIDAHLLWLAAASIGALEVPVDPQLRGDFLRHVLVDAGVRLCFVRASEAAVAEHSGVDGLQIAVVPNEGADADEWRPSSAAVRSAPEDISTVLYTSGTTGAAKGVLVRWGQLTSTLGRIPRWWLTGDDAVYAPWPMFHVTGRTPLVSMADVGGRVVLRDRFSVSTFWDDVQTHRCTTTTVGYVLGLLAAPAEMPTDAQNPLKVCMVATPTAQAAEVAQRFDFGLVGAYGSTEIGFPIVHRFDDPLEAGWAGWVRPGYAVRVVGTDGVDVDEGDAGELWVRPQHPSMFFAGYLNHPELTAAATHGGWYRTGDTFVRRHDGAFRFVDRLRDTIRRFGESVSATSLEQVVTAVPGISECAVVGVPSKVAGQEIFVVATLGAGATLQAGDLFEALTDAVPRHMLPSYIAFVRELPKTPSGKVRKHDLVDEQMRSVAWHRRTSSDP